MMSREPQYTSRYWTGGNAMSWAVGVSLGLLLGLILLIVIPRTLGHAAAAPAAEAAAPAASAPADTAKTDTASTDTASTDTTKTDAAKTDTASTDTAKTDGATADASADGDAAAGKTKFAGTCAGCHGANAEGGVGPALSVAKDWTLEQLTAAVREGHAPDKTLAAMMPHFTTDQVSDADLNNIHAFIKTLQ